MLVGNKYDLVENNTSARQVSLDEATKFADKYNLMYAETSAKTGYNIKEAFEGLIEGNNKGFLSENKMMNSCVSRTEKTSNEIWTR